MTAVLAPTDDDGGPVLGSILPRIFTPPLAVGPPGPCGCGCALTPLTSYGFDVEAFADRVLRRPLDPWERWLVIHAGEYLAYGVPRFRHVLVIVARQNGKTWLLTVLSLYWLFVEMQGLVLTTSSTLDYAKEAWEAGARLALATPDLERKLPLDRTRGQRRANGEQTLSTIDMPAGGSLDPCRWKIAASNRRGGRSLSVSRLVQDELREHDTWDAWNAAVPTTNAQPRAQVWGISNMGDARAVVLNARRATTMSGDDPAHGLFGWSAPREARTDDPRALAQANPQAGRRIMIETLVSDARQAVLTGGEALEKFRTEILCIAVQTRRPALDAAAWAEQSGTVDLKPLRRGLAVVFDVSPDGQHASAVAAARVPGSDLVMVDVLGAWQGPDAARRLRNELPALLGRAQPRVLGWFPDGPAASVAADMQRAAAGPRRAGMPVRMRIEAITTDTAAACMGFAIVVQSRELVHADDPMLNAHVQGAERLDVGDRWRFVRRGIGHCDGAYAAAGAVHLARSMPAPPPPLSVASHS